MAGLTEVAEKFSKTMAQAAGSDGEWQALRANLVAQGRYAELFYD